MSMATCMPWRVCGKPQFHDAYRDVLLSDTAGSVYLVSIACTLRLREVYDRIDFPPDTPEYPDKA